MRESLREAAYLRRRFGSGWSARVRVAPAIEDSPMSATAAAVAKNVGFINSSQS